MRYSPHDLLPCKHPKDEEFKNKPDFFYNEVVHHLIPDVIRIMANGIPIDLDKVSELETVVIDVLNSVDECINKSSLIHKFTDEKYKKQREKKYEQLESSLKNPEDFLREFKISNKVHRKYFMDAYLESIGKLEECSIPNWTMKDIKALNLVYPSSVLDQLINKTISTQNALVLTAMRKLAKDKADIHNKKYNDKFNSLTKSDLVEPFNCASSIQVREFLSDFLGIDSEQQTKSGNLSYKRTEIERILAEVELRISLLD